MTAQRHARLAELIANPPPGSKLAAAKEYGIDLTLLLNSLERTPTERAETLCATALFFGELGRAGERLRTKK